MLQKASISFRDPQVVQCEGNWTLQALPELERRIDSSTWPQGSSLVCEAGGISAMDTGGAVLLQRTLNDFQQKGRPVTIRGLRPEFAELLHMVSMNWEKIEPKAVRIPKGWLETIGIFGWERLWQGVNGLAFLGESAVAIFRLLIYPRAIRWRAFLRSLEIDGFHALPITGLLTFLMGIVIAYQGAEQLRTVGANIFVVDLVGISLLREIAPLVTAILVAGRSGSAYTAEIGTMKVTEELDALRTLGLSPMQLLVIPKALALVIALPLLTVFADAVGVAGGMLVASSLLGIGYHEFLTRFEEAVALKHFVIGVGKAPIFAGIIALVGCYQGFQIRGGVDDVGRHTTISVVQSIFLVIVFDASFSILLNWWGL